MKKIIAILLSILMACVFTPLISAEETDIMYETPFERGTAGSETFRIPSIITLNDGSVLAAADMRYEDGLDSPNNIDTLLAKSPDGYSDWEYTVVNHFDDYPDGVSNENSASFIDPSMVQSKATDRIILITDVFPSGGGAWTAQRGTGCIKIGGKKYLALTDGNDITDFSKFGYYIGDFENGFAPVFTAADSEATAYSVDTEYYLYKNGEQLYMEQAETGEKIKQNVFYMGADLSLYRTMHLCMRYSDDNGKTWSDLQILTPSVKSEKETFLGVGPGKGFVTEYKGKERIIFCVYDNSRGTEYVSTIYSDDNGETWNRGNETSVTHTLGKTSEAQIVSLPDGTLRMFARTAVSFVAYADSVDGGVTWTKFTADDSLVSTANCMVSFINYSKKVSGRSVILGSFGSDIIQRADGVVKVGLVGDSNKIKWISTYHVNDGFYAYSCLTELADGNIALLYEDEPYHIAYMVLTLAEDGTLSEVNGSNISFSKIVTFFRELLNKLMSLFLVKIPNLFKI